MKIVIIGGVAAGTSAAAKARRNNDQAQITIYDKDYDVSYSGCGMPYFIGGEIEEVETLRPRDPAFFKKKYNIDVIVRHEVISVDKVNKTLKVKNCDSGEVVEDHYDTLVIATGATSFIPPIEGADEPHVFSLRSIQDAIKIKDYISKKKPRTALVAGSGFIGFEVLESLVANKIEVQLIEVANKITPTLDPDMAKYLECQLESHDITIRKSVGITAIDGKQVSLSNGDQVTSDMVILATGVRPNVTLAKALGLEIGVTGAIKVDWSMKTSDDSIYACGDCIETFSLITGEPAYRPLGSTANKTGRIAGDVITGGSMSYRGNLGTGIFRVFDLAVASTGLSEEEALLYGYEVEVVHNIKPDKPLYYKGKNMVIKAVADRESKKLLGVQIIGESGVDKRVDVFATLITYGATVDELFHLDLAYAPPFSTTKDPVHYTGMILDNAINKGRKIITSKEVRENQEDIQIIDARTNKDYSKKGCVDQAINMPHSSLREQMKELDPKKKTVTYCNKGVTGNAAQNILLNNGFEDVSNLSGGHTFYKATGEKGTK